LKPGKKSTCWINFNTMTGAYIIADNIYSPLGSTSVANFMQLKKSQSGVKYEDDTALSPTPFYASLFNKAHRFLHEDVNNKFTKFEKLLINSIGEALQSNTVEPGDRKTALIISTTKGNISLLETETYNKELETRISLTSSANVVATHFKFVNKPIVVSNACISGMLAILTGMRLIESGEYENVVVTGADIISKFILSGFQSFQAVSENRCKPFDVKRAGINLGEGAGTVILSSNKKHSTGIKVTGGSVSNDANHISGPSRTGEELHLCIYKALQNARLAANNIDFVSAHGTATIYNDEMEAKAIALSNLQSVPVNSLKGNYGHTLGAAGIIESVVSIHSLKENTMIPTMGFEQLGVTQPINVCASLYNSNFNNCLKTASGFGGCNAALVFSKQ
jgi:3-oxoacyl-[acyl-carrier-protein] synthase I